MTTTFDYLAWLAAHELEDFRLGKRAKDRRPSAALRGYGHRWRVERADYLKSHPDCTTVDCGGKATHVDHRRRVRDTAQASFWDRRGWRGLCQSCHNAKSGKQTHEGRVGSKILSEKTRHTPR